MKQHINPEQIQELSDKGKERLREWQVKHGWDIKGEIDPIPNIGQMIEFLDHKLEGIEKVEMFDGKRKWDVELTRFTDFPEFEELCDALWSACKEVLEQ